MSTHAGGGASAWNSVFHSGPNVPEQHERYHRGQSPIAIDLTLNKQKNADNLIIQILYNQIINVKLQAPGLDKRVRHKTDKVKLNKNLMMED